MLLLPDLINRIIGAAIEVHRNLGPGMLEKTYESCLAKEFSLRGISFQRQVRLPVEYKGMSVHSGYRVDMIVEKQVIIEIKAVDRVLPVHVSQLISYLRFSKLRVGFVMNFNVRVLKDGLFRRVL